MMMYYFQFTIKPVDKKAPDFIFFAPKLRINKLVSLIYYLSKIVNSNINEILGRGVDTGNAIFMYTNKLDRDKNAFQQDAYLPQQQPGVGLDTPLLGAGVKTPPRPDPSTYPLGVGLEIPPGHTPQLTPWVWA